MVPVVAATGLFDVGSGEDDRRDRGASCCTYVRCSTLEDSSFAGRLSCVEEAMGPRHSKESRGHHQYCFFRRKDRILVFKEEGQNHNENESEYESG